MSGKEAELLELIDDGMTVGNGCQTIASDTTTLHSWLTANLKHNNSLLHFNENVFAFCLFWTLDFDIYISLLL